MRPIRILVDGYSLLHAWTQLASGYARHSEQARESLIQALTHYQDTTGIPVSVIFDGRRAGRPKSSGKPDAGEIEVIYSTDGKTADDLIERVAHGLSTFGPVMVVTNDYAEADTVRFVGGFVSSCDNFVRELQAESKGLSERIQRHNRSEKRRSKLI